MLGQHSCDPLCTDGKALVKLAPAEELKRARDEKKATAEAKLARKAAAAQAEEQRRLAKLEKGKIAPNDLFRPPQVDEGLYSQWDEQGIPTHDGQGVELSKGKTKKMKKEWEAQVKAHDEWKKIVESGGKV
jgi:cysteinyl-tRNA synthetase